jgi:hypothetical protein
MLSALLMPKLTRRNFLSIDHEKIPANDSIYAHAQDFATSDELLLTIHKAFVLQEVNKQQTVDFYEQG